MKAAEEMKREQKEVKLRMILQDYHRRNNYELQQAVNDILALDALPPAEGAKKVQWSGYGELGNISQKPLQPTAEITTDRFRDILNDVQRYIETNGGATESEMKAIWNSLSCAITESERRQPTAEGAEEIIDDAETILRSHPYLKVWTETLFDSEMKVCSIEQALWAIEKAATLHAQKIADKMVEEMRQKLFSMRASKETMDMLSEADRLITYGYHDCINEMLMWTKGIEK